MKNSEGFGRPVRRVDGPLKVTGHAKYSGEYSADDLLHGCIVSSTIAKGRITNIDVTAAMALPGVVKVFTHENRPEMSEKSKDYKDEVGPPGEPFRPLADDRVLYSDQPVALVVAENFEAARDAAALVKITYAPEPYQTDLQLAEAYIPPKKRSGIAPPPKPRGNFEKAYAASPIQFEAEYYIPPEHHQPMEPFATTCVWNGDGSITVYDKTQGSQNVQSYLANIFDLKPAQVRVVNSYVGGAFGSGLRPQHQVFFAVMASTAMKRSVRVVLDRSQLFGFTHRPETIQTIKLGANLDGELLAIGHEATGATSRFEDHQEVVVNWTGLQYHAENVELTYKLAKLDTASPGDMRAPGAMIGQFASESAIDELSYQLKMDPIALRLKNYTEKDENQNKQFTSKALRECYAVGAQAFGWERRKPEPRSMQDGRELVGWGMASAAWESLVSKTAASVSLSADGHLTVSSATSDIGTGTYTIMSQTGAEALGLPVSKVTARLGDSDLPAAPVEGGSWGAASTCSAIYLACDELKKQLLHHAAKMSPAPIGNPSTDEVIFANGRITCKDDPSKSVSLEDVVRSSGKPQLTAEGTVKPGLIQMLRYVSYTHAAVFVEVRVDEELGVIRITRVVSATAAGRILNPKTARSQILGGIVMAIGSALHEESYMDHRLGRFMNHNLAEYHVPSNADIEDIEVIFVEEHDDKASPIGAKGLGEIGIVGTGAAIANAVFHATGRRVRDLPITIDKMLGLTNAT